MSKEPIKAEYGWPPRGPIAHPQFRHKVEEPLRSRIVEACQPSGLLSSKSVELRALHSSASVAGSYRLSVGNDLFFIRVTSRLGNADIEKSIVSYLDSAGVSVNPILAAGLPVSLGLGERYRLDIRPFIEGRHIVSGIDDKDLHEAGRMLKKCHDSLREFPDAQYVRQIAKNRYLELQATLSALSFMLNSGAMHELGPYENWVRRNADWFARMAQEFKLDFSERDGAQCLHGEPHVGNVLFRKDTSAPVLIDFEESPWTFAPVEWDLAFFFQRFCLSDRPAKEVVKKRFELFQSAYGFEVFGLQVYMREICWFSVVSLIHQYLFSKTEAPLLEAQKFVDLEQQAASLSEFL